MSMTRGIALALALAVAAVAAHGVGPPEEADRAHRRALTDQAAQLQVQLRAAEDARQRKKLADQIEALFHQIGPVDANGKDVQPKAMWHAAAIATMETDAKRLERPASIPDSELGARGKTAVRKMAAACLALGWAAYQPEPVKYQVDVFGAYLANNTDLLDPFFDRLSAWAALEASLREAGADPQSVAPHVAAARTAVDAMTSAAERLAGLKPTQAVSAPGPMGAFLGALKDARAADAALRAWQAAREANPEKEPGEPGKPPPPVPAAAPEPAPPPMTAQERDALGAVRAAAAKLEGDAWHDIRRSLERYADAIENGFAVPSARPRVREFLEHVDRAARLAEGLATTKAVYPEYREEMRGRLEQAVRSMESPLDRPRGYDLLRRVAEDDAYRRNLEDGGLSDGGALGVLYCRRIFYSARYATADPAIQHEAVEMRNACDAIAHVGGRLEDWPPADMAGKLRTMYARAEEIYRREASAAGAHFPDRRTAGIRPILSAGEHARDVERIIRADRVIKAVAKYMPNRARAMYAQLALASAELVSQKDIRGGRRKLEHLIRPFEGLEGFPMPEPEYHAAAAKIAGRAYTPARNVFARRVAEGIEAASEGNGRPLSDALEVRRLFSLLRIRAVSDTVGLDEPRPGCYYAFSLPEPVWEAFVESTNQLLRSMVAAYAKDGPGDYSWLRAPDPWNHVYRAGAGAARQTLDARADGETDLDFLVRCLERATATEPGRRTWYSWAAGYHLTEAAAGMNAGLSHTAGWHRGQLGRFDRYVSRLDLETGDRRARGRRGRRR